MMGLTWGSEFGELGAIVDLKSAYPGEVAAMKERVFSGLWDSVEYKGRVFGIPFDMTEFVVFYRNDIIKTPPADWEELTNLLERLKCEGRGMIFDWGSMSWIGYSPFLWQAGVDYYSDDYSTVTLDSEAALISLKFFSELYTKYGVPKTKVPLEQAMMTADFPLAISGNWRIESFRISAPEMNSKWSIATMPKGPAGKMTGFIGGRTMGIFAQSAHKEAAWQFIKFLFKPDSQAKLYAAAVTKHDAYLPPRRDTWAMLTMDPEFRRVLIAQADDSKGPPAIANWDSCAEYVDEAIQRVVLQGADVSSELKNAKKQIERKCKAGKCPNP
jgi:multiple sugar transport system substrate-binding protein